MSGHFQALPDSTGISGWPHGASETDDSVPAVLNTERLVQRMRLDNADSESTFGDDPGEGLNLVWANRKQQPKLPSFKSRSPIRSSERFISVQKWEGYVVEVSKGEFVARLIDQSRGGEDEEATISLRRVSRDDLDLVVPGGVFYWSIGDQTDLTGRRHTVSELRFRRLPPFTQDDIDKAKLEGKQLHDWITGENGKATFPSTSSRRD